ncbi:MAG: hypothetical protein HYR49_04250 [Gammaproteobacteria bacterium]|nr:hypothetical protein [Gammaproteobacteria bacterium]
MKPIPTGRTGPRIRCIGRTDDMLIVRGVNLFPAVIRSILKEFSPDVAETFRIFPRNKGVRQTPPLPLVVELGEGHNQAPEGLVQRMSAEIRSRLVDNSRAMESTEN